MNRFNEPKINRMGVKKVFVTKDKRIVKIPTNKLVNLNLFIFF